MAGPDWHARLATRIAQLDALPWMTADMPRANANMVRQVVATAADGEKGACYVANISSEHIPAFCDPAGPGYVNTYDLEKRLGAEFAVSKRRERVDVALAKAAGVQADQIYFGAAELNGSGIRYYGDLCLVLRPHPDDAETRILISNSYDLTREPLSALTGTAEGLLAQARDMLGTWVWDLADMAALKVFAYRSGERRLTTGQISDGLLDDEDYIEILRVCPFGPDDVEEVRISAASASAETRIAERIARGPPPDAAALLWRQRRRTAEKILNDLPNSIPVRVVTNAGRVRG